VSWVWTGFLVGVCFIGITRKGINGRAVWSTMLVDWMSMDASKDWRSIAAGLGSRLFVVCVMEIMSNHTMEIEQNKTLQPVP